MQYAKCPETRFRAAPHANLPHPRAYYELPRGNSAARLPEEENYGESYVGRRRHGRTHLPQPCACPRAGTSGTGSRLRRRGRRKYGSASRRVERNTIFRSTVRQIPSFGLPRIVEKQRLHSTETLGGQTPRRGNTARRKTRHRVFKRRVCRVAVRAGGGKTRIARRVSRIGLHPRSVESHSTSERRPRTHRVSRSRLRRVRGNARAGRTVLSRPRDRAKGIVHRKGTPRLAGGGRKFGRNSNQRSGYRRTFGTDAVLRGHSRFGQR